MNGVMHRDFRSRTRSLLFLEGTIVTTTGGTIDSNGSNDANGFTVARDGTGNYGLTFVGPGGEAATVKSVRWAEGVALIGTWVAGKGLVGRMKSVTGDDTAGYTKVNIEFTDDTGAADDVPDGATIKFLVICRDSELAK